MMGHFGSVFVLSIFLQQHLGMTPLQAGLVFLPAVAFCILGNVISGVLSNRFGPRMPIVLGLIFMATGFTAILITAPLGSPLLVAGFLILSDSGGSLASPQVTSVVLASVQQQHAATAIAVYNTFRQIRGAFGIAVLGGLIADHGNFIPGMQLSFIIATSLLLLTALAAFFIRQPAQEPVSVHHVQP